jgi:ribosomal protein S18 acetylase RimI-like enzyme
MSLAFRIELLGAQHDRSGFSCGQEPLDRYLATQAGQDAKRRIASCFVAVERETGEVAGYYTLASAGIPMTELPETVTKKLPRYPSIPAVRIGRLAVDVRFQGCGLGAAMLADAVSRVTESSVAAFALLVDAKDEKATGFYRRFGFASLSSQPMTMFLPMATAMALDRAERIG